jgi:hypothetical protein
MFSLVFAVALIGAATGLYTIQSWLENRTYDKHFND